MTKFYSVSPSLIEQMFGQKRPVECHVINAENERCWVFVTDDPFKQTASSKGFTTRSKPAEWWMPRFVKTVSMERAIR